MNSQKYEWNNWQEIDWETVKIAVFKLRKRIYRASQRGDTKSVNRLQRLLRKSYYGRLWAMREPTQESPLNQDRAKQCLVKLALEPQWQPKFENNRHSFPSTMSCHDAIEAIYHSICKQPQYVLDTDISKCFDKINYDQLLSTIEIYPALKRQIKAWLKSGVIDKSRFPNQEAVISSLLANIALNGIELELKRYAQTLDMKGKNGIQILKKDQKSSLSLIRYADNFLVLHKDINVILKCQEIIENWFSDRKLALKPSQTSITHTLYEHNGKTGFDFLGFSIRQYPTGKHNRGKSPRGNILGFKTVIAPSKEKVKAHIKKLGDMIDKYRCQPQSLLMIELNPIIKEWSNYYKTVSSKDIFTYCDYILYQQLKRWAIRRHPNKSKYWVKNKYWHTNGTKNYLFGVKKNGEIIGTLLQHQATERVRRTKVKSGISIDYASEIDGSKW
ncbi:MAG: reverse transcriptase domain-containing protein [Crocosphaera sp.]|nr:reverse transcriptase domain-containing protein [Crocosphaera sp.]